MEPITITIPGRLPSWNDVLNMHHWKRTNYKHALQDSFLSVLQASEKDSSTRTTFAKSTISTACATLGLFLTIRQIKSASKRPKGKRARTKMKG
jgi:hypothetical protein